MFKPELGYGGNKADNWVHKTQRSRSGSSVKDQPWKQWASLCISLENSGQVWRLALIQWANAIPNSTEQQHSELAHAAEIGDFRHGPHVSPQGVARSAGRAGELVSASMGRTGRSQATTQYGGPTSGAADQAGPDDSGRAISPAPEWDAECDVGHDRVSSIYK